MAKILLVEDDPMIAEIYMRKFKTAGFDAVNATNGKEVLKLASQDKFDLILLDLVLPELGGMEVLKELKKSGSYDPGLKVVIFSNLNQTEIQEEAMKNGANGFIGKMQYSPSDLVVEIQRLLNEYVEQEKNKEKLNGAPQNGSGKKRRILLIEDEKIFQEMFGKKLEDEGYEVVTADNGAWGVEEAMKGGYDVIITDMVMPAMTGEEIIAKLKDNEKTKNVPIIAISASVPEEKVEGVKDMGVAEFFLKTRIVPSDLSRKIGELLGKA